MRTYIIQLVLSIYGSVTFPEWQERVHLRCFVSYLAECIIFMGVFYIFGMYKYSYELLYLCELLVMTFDEARLTYRHRSDRLSAGAYRCKSLAETGVSVGDLDPLIRET